MKYIDVPNCGKGKFLKKNGKNLNNVPEKIDQIPQDRSLVCLFNIDTIMIVRDQKKLDYLLQETEIKNKNWYLLEDKYIKEKRLENA